jgi:hypothetical protein
MRERLSEITDQLYSNDRRSESSYRDNYRNACSLLDRMSDLQVERTLAAVENGYPYEEGTTMNGLTLEDWHMLVQSEHDNRRFR